MLGVHWRISRPAAWALPFLQISPIPRQLLGQSRVSPPFPCLGPQGQGQPILPRRGLDGTRRILRAPCAPGPCRLLHRARLRSSRHGQSCRRQGQQQSPPGMAGRGGWRRGRTQVCVPCPTGVGAQHRRAAHAVVPWMKGTKRRSCARTGASTGAAGCSGSPQQPRSRWAPRGEARVSALRPGDGFPGGRRIV